MAANQVDFALTELNGDAEAGPCEVFLVRHGRQISTEFAKINLLLNLRLQFATSSVDIRRAKVENGNRADICPRYV